MVDRPEVRVEECVALPGHEKDSCGHGRLHYKRKEEVHRSQSVPFHGGL